MNPECILAHRGLWESKADANSRESILRAFEHGFGIETDLRATHDGNIIVSHDAILSDKEPLTLQWLLDAHKSISPSSILALNIKADGLHSLIKTALNELDDDKYFLFDMSVPDLISGSPSGLRQFGRVSCYEDPVPLAPYIKGLWVDCFDNLFPALSDIQELARCWPTLAFVSPELHGRNYQTFWDILKASEVSAHTKLMLCTDHPAQAYEFFR
jgi:glycerophosphoryl diester phosphodiesterase